MAIQMARPSLFGEWLKERRKTLDMTQAELAQQIGCAKVTLRKLESGVQRPSKQMAARLAEVLHVAPVEQVSFVQFARSETSAMTSAGQPASFADSRRSSMQRAINLP